MSSTLINIESTATYDGDRLRRELAIEVARLDNLLEKYYGLAMAGDGSNINAGLLYCKLATRKSALLGLDATQGFAVSIIHQTAPEHYETSTAQLEAAIARLTRPALS